MQMSRPELDSWLAAHATLTPSAGRGGKGRKGRCSPLPESQKTFKSQRKKRSAR
ncbi:hypothetical protein C3O00_001703 [Salmonella enterica subsp. enterica serovar Mountpleasant]|nr:hypothetical protein [Salmonella enterica subsp. enterica serovar Mountpleasant]